MAGRTSEHNNINNQMSMKDSTTFIWQGTNVVETEEGECYKQLNET